MMRLKAALSRIAPLAAALLFLLLLGFVWACFEDNQLRLWREVREFTPNVIYNVVNPEPARHAIFDYIIFFIAAFVMLHLLIFYLIPHYTGATVGSMARFFSATDYLWYTAAIAGIVITVNTLTIKQNTEQLVRVDELQRFNMQRVEETHPLAYDFM